MSSDPLIVECLQYHSLLRIFYICITIATSETRCIGCKRRHTTDRTEGSRSVRHCHLPLFLCCQQFSEIQPKKSQIISDYARRTLV